MDLGGGAFNTLQVNSQTHDRSETGKAAFVMPQRDGSSAHFKFFIKGHMSDQGKVKGQNWAFPHFGSHAGNLTQAGPNSAEMLSNVKMKVLHGHGNNGDYAKYVSFENISIWSQRLPSFPKMTRCIAQLATGKT